MFNSVISSCISWEKYLIFILLFNFANGLLEKDKYLNVIVKFVQFLSTTDGENLLKFILPFYDKSWELQKRPYRQVYTTDFQTIFVNTLNFTLITTTLKRYSIIQSVNLNSHINDRKPLFLKPQSNGYKIPYYLQADLLWSMGIKGEGVRVGIFDTGIADEHPHFKTANIVEITNWTDEPNSKDTVGHGTFVAGMFVSDPDEEDAGCPRGIAPDVELYIFRLFTKKQTSYTSWFLDAFNYALARKIHLINLSIGGPDFQDRPFVEKVWELSANGILMISASGNDGPLYGTHNNPADQMDVVGVGGIDFNNQLTRFSSRGMTTWEIPHGYGRIKPDLVTYSHMLISTNHKGGCKSLSGTSVASPSVAAISALLISSHISLQKTNNFTVYDDEVKQHKFNSPPSPASIKQALLSSATRLPRGKYNMFEQGMGKLNMLGAYRTLLESKPQVSAYPSYIDLTEIDYMWPYSAQPIYSSAIPIIINITLLNSMAASGSFLELPRYHGLGNFNGDRIHVQLSHSQILWPWSGYLAVAISVPKSNSHWSGIAEGYITAIVQSKISTYSLMNSTLTIPLRVKVIPTPSRRYRILWDQFHNLRYPPGYIPRDDVRRQEPLDWTGDHIHTNFKDSFNYLRTKGYFIEVLGSHYGCFDASLYGTLVIVDPEEEFFHFERSKLFKDVVEFGLSLIVLAEWYNTELMQHLRFFDENTRQWWTPDTGGANIPALNDLLNPFGIMFSSQVVEGVVKVGSKKLHYKSGTTLLQFPDSIRYKSRVLYTRDFSDLTSELVYSSKKYHKSVGILGFYGGPKDTNGTKNHGRISVFGDSNCFDMTYREEDHNCLWLWDDMLKFSHTGYISLNLATQVKQVKSDLISINDPLNSIPRRLKNNQLHRFSSVLKFSSDQFNSEFIYHKAPKCGEYGYLSLLVDNITRPNDSWYKPQLLLKFDFTAPMRNLNYESQSLDKRIDYGKKSESQAHYYRGRSFHSRIVIVTAPNKIHRFYAIAIFCICSVVLILFYQRFRRPLRLSRSNKLLLTNAVAAGHNLSQFRK